MLLRGPSSAFSYLWMPVTAVSDRVWKCVCECATLQWIADGILSFNAFLRNNYARLRIYIFKIRISKIVNAVSGIFYNYNLVSGNWKYILRYIDEDKSLVFNYLPIHNIRVNKYIFKFKILYAFHCVQLREGFVVEFWPLLLTSIAVQFIWWEGISLNTTAL